MEPALVYGRSGSGKTTWWMTIAKYLWLTQQKKTRCYLGDGGGATISINGGEEFVEVYPYTSRVNPFETVAAITSGDWPVDPESSTTQLLQPTLDEWAHIGLVVFEGLTVMGDYIMGSQKGGLADRMARGEILNNDTSFRLKDGSLQVGGNARSHYMLGQRTMWEAVGRTESIPVPVIWTAHERKAGEDESSKESIIGPDIVGQALTAKIGACFGYAVHLHPVHATKKTKDATTGGTVEQMALEYRAYTQDHYDPNLRHYVRYYANVRVPALIRKEHPEIMPEWIPADSLDFLRRLQEARDKGDALERERILKMPNTSTLYL